MMPSTCCHIDVELRFCIGAYSNKVLITISSITPFMWKNVDALQMHANDYPFFQFDFVFQNMHSIQ